jgi:hypothetical protein
MIVLMLCHMSYASTVSSAPATSSSPTSENNTDRNTSSHFSIPTGAELLESIEFKSDGISYIIERKYRLLSGETLWAYYDIDDGSNGITIQRIEQTPILVLGTDVNISGMPGYREFNFGENRRKLVQFLKIMRLGWQENPRSRGGGIRTPSLSDHVFNGIASWRSEFILLLDLYDDTWVLEHRQYSFGDKVASNTTAFFRVNEFRD